MVQVTQGIAEKVAEHVIDNLIKKSKYKFIHIDEVTSYLKKKLEDEYTSELGISVKNSLIEHGNLDFFREGDCFHESKYYYCTGNWLAIKGMYKNPVQAKEKMGLLAWQVRDGEEDSD